MPDSITSNSADSRPVRHQKGRSQASGKFLLRLDPQLHGLLRDDARAAGVSLNDWCCHTLAAPGAAGLAPASIAVQALRSRLRDDLTGVVLYGSFARGEFAVGSDIDLLVVLAAGVPITRSLYRQWEGAVPSWHGREIDLHFVHLPTLADPVSGSWAEAAVCGIVLFEKDLAVSRHLIEVRHRIAAGELRRRTAQGQPYWIHEDRDAQS